jgi:signal peptidase I
MPAMSDAAANAPAAPAKRETNVKETIESILIAFILAFIFRAFIVEAFVIPTGSMATTLLGAHMRFDCLDCGYPFTVNYSGDSLEGDIQIPAIARKDLVDRQGRRTGQSIDQVFALHCPNCGFRVPRRDDARPEQDATAPPVHFGDRILVLKYVYLLRDPARWDVVVFKSPDSDRRDYSQNYIKRLVGRPNESLVLVDGDIYTGPYDADEPEQFRIARKDRAAQAALWRIVYDHDFQPVPPGRPRDVTNAANQVVRVEPKFEIPWNLADGTGWKTDENDRRVFVFDQSAGAGALRFNSAANPTRHPLTDWLAYDVTVNQSSAHGTNVRPLFDLFERGGYVRGQHPLSNVSDVKLAFHYHRLGGEGPLRLTLTKLDQVLVAEFVPGQVRLLHRDGEAGELRRVGETRAPEGVRPMRIEFVNADYRAQVIVNGQVLLEHEYEPRLRELIEADVANREHPRPTIEIAAENQQSRVSHLSVWRDVFYASRGENLAFVPRATPYNFPFNVVRLKDDEYFVLGDNPLISGDARSWRSGVELPRENLFVEAGRVPGQFLLGKAFFVYWPAGFRPFPGAPGIVPNFGDMRFIH